MDRYQWRISTVGNLSGLLALAVTMALHSPALAVDSGEASENSARTISSSIEEKGSLAAAGTTIHGCYSRHSAGSLRIVARPQDCHWYEQALSWSQQGPPGPKGDTGRQGDPGPQGPRMSSTDSGT